MRNATAYTLVGASLLSVGIAFGYLIKAVSERDALERKLTPYVEMVDKKPGLSQTDITDFARRAGFVLSQRELANPNVCLCRCSRETLQRALNSYKSEKTNSS